MLHSRWFTTILRIEKINPYVTEGFVNIRGVRINRITRRPGFFLGVEYKILVSQTNEEKQQSINITLKGSHFPKKRLPTRMESVIYGPFHFCLYLNFFKFCQPIHVSLCQESLSECLSVNG